MIKTIHCIMIGNKSTFSDSELECIDSWKRVYPDWEIRLWKNEDCIDWINESKFASYHYYTSECFAYVSDYLRCKIVYECGGMYMDTDVYAVNRIPDSYFEKPFIPWDSYGQGTNTGTCLYAPPKSEIIGKFEKSMKDFDSIKVDNSTAMNNATIDPLLEKLYDFKKAGCEKDVDYGDIAVLNRSQFGMRHTDKDACLVTEERTPYLCHICAGSWTPIYLMSGYVNLHYAIIDKNTNLKELEKRLLQLRAKHISQNGYLLLIADNITLSEDFLWNIFWPLKNVVVQLLPFSGNKRKNALDIILHLAQDCHLAKDIMRDIK